MKIYQYRPAFFDGFETEEYEVFSKEELLQTPLMQRFQKDNHTGFKVVPEQRMIFALYGPTRETWGVGYAKTDEEALLLQEWFSESERRMTGTVYCIIHDVYYPFDGSRCPECIKGFRDHPGQPEAVSQFDRGQRALAEEIRSLVPARDYDGYSINKEIRAILARVLNIAPEEV